MWRLYTYVVVDGSNIFNATHLQKCHKSSGALRTFPSDWVLLDGLKGQKNYTLKKGFFLLLVFDKKVAPKGISLLFDHFILTTITFILDSRRSRTNTASY